MGQTPVYEPFRFGFLFIRIPYFSMLGWNPRLPFDSSIMNQPMQLTLKLAPFNTFGVVSSGMENEFKDYAKVGYVQWTEELSNPSLSIKSTLRARPDFNCTYPFQLFNYLPIPMSESPTFDGISADGTVANGNLKNSPIFTLNLTSLIDADLTGFNFFCVWRGDEEFGFNPTTSALTLGSVVAIFADGKIWNPKIDDTKISFSSGQPALGRRLIDPLLTLNQQRFQNYPMDSYETVIMCKKLDEVGFDVRVPTINTALDQLDKKADTLKSAEEKIIWNATSSSIQRSYMYELPQTWFLPLTSESDFQNCPRYQNQTWQIRFQIDRSGPGWSGSQPVDNRVGFTLYVMYSYNALLLVGSNGGTTTLITH